MSFLSIQNVSKSFRTDDVETEVLTPLSLDIDRGELVTFLGPSGCGKTTLMRMVGGLESIEAGRITLDGKALGPPDRRRGMVFQSYAAFPWLTVRGNIAFGLKYRTDLTNAEKTEITDRYLDMVGLAAFANQYTNRISGGMRQRVAIARTLASDPDVLLMDEPFGALDALTREHLQQQLLQINAAEQKTTIFVTHDVEEAILLAHRVVIFSARPAQILSVVDVGARLGTQRDEALRQSAEFQSLRHEIQDTIRVEYARAREAEEAHAV
ncbi:MAG: ABC transporter ATP-binding protein [Pseudomonadota bacterium]